MTELHKILPAHWVHKHQILPLKADDDQVLLAASGELEEDIISELEFTFNTHVIVEIWEAEELASKIRETYYLTESAQDSIDENGAYQHVSSVSEPSDSRKGDALSDDQSTIHLVNRFLSEAIRMKASDIHVESYEEELRIRFRLDGRLIEFEKPPLSRRDSTISRLKIMADMDIAEKRRPQDGRIQMRKGDKTVDIRVSSLPTGFGEKIVLRILDKSNLNLSLESLGMNDIILKDFKRTLRLPHGMILVTGPTGCGKSTTLYAALNYLNDPGVNITTIEDPVEYNLPGINQTMVKTNISLSFANILRTVLRQDPDIIMLGEIRDCETAGISVRSALTGHLVLSTLHTNDAVSSVVRLVDMGVEPFLVGSSLKMVVAQRLVRRICNECKTKYSATQVNSSLKKLDLNLDFDSLYYGTGCSSCFNTGFSGRIALVEHLVVDDEFAELIQKNTSVQVLRSILKNRGGLTLHDAAIEKVACGMTTLDEIAVHLHRDDDQRQDYKSLSA